MTTQLPTSPPPQPLKAGTRQQILQAAFQQFYEHGFQGSSLDTILHRVSITKGALYHYFPSKAALALAVVEEVVREWIDRQWLRPLGGDGNPLDDLVRLARWGEREATRQRMEKGCPLNNLMQEMAFKDEDLRLRLQDILLGWHSRLAERLEQGQRKGSVRTDIDPHEAAMFIIASWQGSIGLVKGTRSRKVLRSCRRGLEFYLEALRP